MLYRSTISININKNDFGLSPWKRLWRMQTKININTLSPDEFVLKIKFIDDLLIITADMTAN